MDQQNHNINGSTTQTIHIISLMVMESEEDYVTTNL
jgi:hypothetical protein